MHRCALGDGTEATVSNLNRERELAAANSIHLPRKMPRPEPSVVADAAQVLEFDSLHAAPSTLRHLSILVVDDDVNTLEMIQMVFETHGARVTGVTTAEAALATLRRARLDESYDLLVSDIGLPGMDGYELVQRVRGELQIVARRMPAIAVTAYARAEDREMALQSGFQAHLPKPYDAEQLVATALRLLAKAARGAR